MDLYWWRREIEQNIIYMKYHSLIESQSTLKIGYVKALLLHLEMVECRSVIWYIHLLYIYLLFYIFISNWAVCLNSDYLCMFSEGARMRIWFIAVRANKSLLRCMDTYVLLFITAVCKTPFAGLKRASERFFTCNKKRQLNPVTSCNINKKKQQQQQLKCYPYVSFHEFSGFPPG